MEIWVSHFDQRVQAQKLHTIYATNLNKPDLNGRAIIWSTWSIMSSKLGLHLHQSIWEKATQVLIWWKSLFSLFSSLPFIWSVKYFRNHILSARISILPAQKIGQKIWDWYYLQNYFTNLNVTCERVGDHLYNSYPMMHFPFSSTERYRQHYSNTRKNFDDLVNVTSMARFICREYEGWNFHLWEQVIVCTEW